MPDAQSRRALNSRWLKPSSHQISRMKIICELVMFYCASR